MIIQEIEFKIDSHVDRIELLSILAESGYKVWVKKTNDLTPKHIVVVEVEK